MLAVKQNNKTVAVNRIIKLGMSYLDKIVVTEGLSKDDQIIIEGNEDLIEGQELNKRDAIGVWNTNSVEIKTNAATK